MRLSTAALLVLQAGSAVPEEFLALPGCWPSAGGGPSRSGMARPTSVSAPVEVAWERTPGGVLEGEPLVWGESVYFCVRKSDEQRELHVVDLGTGRELARPTVVRSPAPLVPSVWAGTVVYRSSPLQTTAARARGAVLRPLWTHDAEGSGPPLATAEGVFVASRSGLRKHALVRSVAPWSATGAYVGAPALAGGEVYALEDRDGARFVARVDARSGAIRGRALIGRLRAGADGEARVASFPGACFVRLEAPLALADAALDVRVVGLDAARWFEDRAEFLPWSPSLRQLPSRTTEGWIALLHDARREPVLAQVPLGERALEFVRLAGESTHSRLVRSAAAPSSAGALAFVGDAAIDTRAGQILWRAPVTPSEPATPTRDFVLYVDQGRRLVAVRSKASRAEVAVAPPADLLTPGVLVPRSGAPERGDFRVDRAARSVSRGAGANASTWRLDDVLLLADPQAVIQCGAEPLRGIQRLAREARARELAALAEEARSSGDFALLERLIDEAVEAGADEAALARLEQHLEHAARSRNRPTVKAEIVARVLERRAALERVEAREHWRFAQALLGERRARLMTELLRRTLELDPEHGAAREQVRELLPHELRPTGDFDALDALELATAHARTPVRVSFPREREGTSEPGQAALGLAQRELAARKAWRSDLLALESAGLVIVTPVRRLGELARCVAYGELVCSTLDGLFGIPAGDASARPPLVIELYESKDEYARACQRELQPGMRALENTLGHYDLVANVSRFHMPADGTDGAELLRVAAHELTHHWLRARAPKWSFRALTPADSEAPGYWVVEGFACLVEGLRFDVEGGGWAPGGPGSRRLDLVAQAPPQSLLAWERFFALSYENYDRWQLEGTLAIPSALRLGKLIEPTAEALFYAQAEATAHYLFEGDWGALRPRLFEFLESYYSGRRDALDLPALLGVDPIELGARIQAHARRVME